MPVNVTKIEGMRQFRFALKAMHAEWPKALADTNKELGELAATFSREKAASMGSVWNRSKSAIGGGGTVTGAYVGVFPSKVDKMAGAAFWGMNRHTGWYANPRYRDSPPQHPPWVGNTWEHGVAGQGPYAINDAIAAHSEEILEEYGRMLDILAAQAFPTGAPSPTIQ